MPRKVRVNRDVYQGKGHPNIMSARFGGYEPVGSSKLKYSSK